MLQAFQLNVHFSIEQSGRQSGDLLLQFNGTAGTVSYTHLRAHETPEHLVCRLLLEKKNVTIHTTTQQLKHYYKNMNYDNLHYYSS